MTSEDTTPDGAPRFRARLDRTPSWVFLLLLAGLIGLAFLLSALFPQVFWHPPTPALGMNDDDKCAQYDLPKSNLGFYERDQFGFFYDYYWQPILCDEGYNFVNTATWAVLIVIMLLWAYRLTSELRERVDTGLIFAVVPFLIWGSIYRVLEDSDLFSPWNERNPGPPGNGFLEQYFGVFFITPIIYVIVTFIAVLFLLWGHRAKRLEPTLGPGGCLQYFLYTLILLSALYGVWWAMAPPMIRHWAPPWVVALCALAAYGVAHLVTRRLGFFSTRVAMASYGLLFLFVGVYYLLIWLTGGVGTWRPDAITPNPDALDTLDYPMPLGSGLTHWPLQVWVLGALILGPTLVVLIVRRAAIGLSRPRLDAPETKTNGSPLTALVVLGVLAAWASFITLVGMRDLAQRQIADAWTVEPGRYLNAFAALLVGPAMLLAAPAIARATGRVSGTHPTLVAFATPVNMLLVFSQVCDSMMTALGIDLFGYGEKHQLPSVLIDKVKSLDLPGVLGHFETALSFIPIKTIIVLIVVAAIDMGEDRHRTSKSNLVGLVKLAIIMVGFAPGVRNAVRLMMGS